MSFDKNPASAIFGLFLVLFDAKCLILGQFMQPNSFWDFAQQNNAFSTGGQQPQFHESQSDYGQYMPPLQQQSQPMFGQWFPTYPQHQQQQQYYPPPSNHAPPSQSASSPSFQLPFAAYRGSAFSAPPTKGIDQGQRERLARIANEMENFGAERGQPQQRSESAGNFFQGQLPSMSQFGGNGGGAGEGLQRILASVAEKLPRIAETMAKLSGNGGGGSQFPPSSPAQKEKFIVEEFEGDDPAAAGGKTKADGISLSRREYEIDSGGGGGHHSSSSAGLINSMPEPSSLFSFNKLLSAFGAAGQGGDKSTASAGGGAFDLKGTPILKSEDLEPELIIQQKSTKDGSSSFYGGPKQQREIQHLTPPPELPSAPQNPLNSFLQQFGIANLMPPGVTGIPSKEAAEKTQMGVKLAPAAEEENNNGDLFGSLMRGKLPQMPDWLKQFGIEQMLGGGGQKPAGNGEDASAGNALAQLFGKGTNKGGGGGGGFGLGSVLGSGLDDSPRRRRR